MGIMAKQVMKKKNRTKDYDSIEKQIKKIRS
jgi:hypothetical protein